MGARYGEPLGGRDSLFRQQQVKPAVLGWWFQHHVAICSSSSDVALESGSRVKTSCQQLRGRPSASLASVGLMGDVMTQGFLSVGSRDVKGAADGLHPRPEADVRPRLMLARGKNAA